MVPITSWGRLGNQMFQMAYLVAQQKAGAIPDIYLQYPEFFEAAADEVRAMFSTGIGRTKTGIVGVHVRRTDYVTDRAFVNLSETNYYDWAMALFPRHRFMICSDDPEWCSMRWRGYELVQVRSGHDEISDMNYLASCEHNIIANSSFSWWAAWLNRNPEKQVVYPAQWHTDGVQRVGFPKGWVKI